MPIVKTGREDIKVESAPGATTMLVRLVTVGKYGDETAKVLTAGEARALGRALIEAAGN